MRPRRDFIAGMTDRFAVNLYEQLFVPKPWVSLDRFQTPACRTPDTAYRSSSGDSARYLAGGGGRTQFTL